MVLIGLREIDKGVLEAAKSMGAKTSTIIWKVLLPESMPALVSGITVTAISLVGYTAMAGIIGAGGLGTLAFLDGFQRNRTDVTLMSHYSNTNPCIYYSMDWRYDYYENRQAI